MHVRVGASDCMKGNQPAGRPGAGLLTCFAIHRSHPKSTQMMPDGHLLLPPLGQSTACERDQSKVSLSNLLVSLSTTAPSLPTEPRDDMQT
jgi:hypothetical protein